MKRDREEAYYATGVVFTEDEASQVSRDAGAFLLEAGGLAGKLAGPALLVDRMRKGSEVKRQAAVRPHGSLAP